MLFVKNLVNTWISIISNFSFYFKNKKEIAKFLSNKGISKIKPFNITKWHHQVYLFTGINELGYDLFIKLSSEKGFLDNESNAYTILESNTTLKKHLINKEGFFKTEQLDYLILRKAQGITLTNQWLLENINATKTLINIIDSLTDLKLIHRDIKLDNFIFENDEVKIFDFTFMVSNDEKYNLKEIDLSKRSNVFKLMDAGINYKPSVFVWDDFYSLKTVLENAFIKQSTKKLENKDKAIILKQIEYCNKKLNSNSYTILKKNKG